MDFILCVKVLAVRIEGSALKRALQFFSLWEMNVPEIVNSVQFLLLPIPYRSILMSPEEWLKCHGSLV